jgi:uncharacterized protein (TIGR03083 family)
MTLLADRTIAALQAEHDTLAAVVASLSPDQLTGSSGATQWSVAQVLSHLGSGAEITVADYRAAVGTGPLSEEGFNQSVWDRWNALSAAEQAAGYLETDSELVEALAATTPQQRSAVTVRMGFLPEPISIAAFAGLRLVEAALHGWDVRLPLDPAASVSAGTAEILAEQLEGELAFLFGFIAESGTVAEPTVIDLVGTRFSLVLDSPPRITSTGPDPTARFIGPLESAIRLLSGRLRKEITPAQIEVTGNVSLDELRRIFPGY